MKHLALLGLLLLSGCIKRMGGEHSGQTAAAYYPLSVGNRWTYQARFLGETRDQTVEIIRESDGFFEDSQGARLFRDDYGIRDEKRYLLRDPLQEGQKWSNVVSRTSVEHYVVSEVGKGCDVPAGHFPDCVKITGRNRVDDKVTLVNELTFAAEVGLVRVQVFAENAGKRIPQTSMELMSFALKTGE